MFFNKRSTNVLTRDSQREEHQAQLARPVLLGPPQNLLWAMTPYWISVPALKVTAPWVNHVTVDCLVRPRRHMDSLRCGLHTACFHFSSLSLVRLFLSVLFYFKKSYFWAQSYMENYVTMAKYQLQYLYNSLFNACLLSSSLGNLSWIRWRQIIKGEQTMESFRLDILASIAFSSFIKSSDLGLSLDYTYKIDVRSVSGLLYNACLQI